MLPCSVVKDLLPLYADSASSAESTKLIDEHLQSCQSCQSALALLQAELPQASAQTAAHLFNPFKKLHKVHQRIIALSLAGALLLSGGLTFASLCCSGNWLWLHDCGLLPEESEMINAPKYDAQLTVLMETQLGWPADRITLLPLWPVQTGIGTAGKWETEFIRLVQYGGKEYCVAYMAREYLPGQFTVTRFELADIYDANRCYAQFSSGTAVSFGSAPQED